MKVTVLGGYSASRSTQGENQMKLGTAARKCKGKKGGKFRACVKKQMRKGRKGHRRHKRR